MARRIVNRFWAVPAEVRPPGRRPRSNGHDDRLLVRHLDGYGDAADDLVGAEQRPRRRDGDASWPPMHGWHAIAPDIDPTLYMHLITRAGREPDDIPASGPTDRREECPFRHAARGGGESTMNHSPFWPLVWKEYRSGRRRSGWRWR